MRLQDVEAALREIVAGLEPEVLAADAAAGLVDTFATIERLAGAGKALAARRVADSNLWRGAGERSAAHWLARRSGASVGSAMATLETAARLSELPAVDAVVRGGASCRRCRRMRSRRPPGLIRRPRPSCWGGAHRWRCGSATSAGGSRPRPRPTRWRGIAPCTRRVRCGTGAIPTARGDSRGASPPRCWPSCWWRSSPSRPRRSARAGRGPAGGLRRLPGRCPAGPGPGRARGNGAALLGAPQHRARGDRPRRPGARPPGTG